jgi:hypothetical protein
MSDKILIRCNDGFKEMVDVYADFICSNRSNVMRTIVMGHISEIYDNNKRFQSFFNKKREQNQLKEMDKDIPLVF